jgi:cytoskeletal protein RodZ
MQSIGERLEEARKRLGMSLREASEATKIRLDYLQHLENGNFDFPLPEVYKRGFLKIYARHVKLDPEKIAADFNALHLGAARQSKRDGRDHLGRVEFAGREGSAVATAEAGDKEPVAGGSVGGRELVSEPLDRSQFLRIVVVVGVLFVGIVLLFFAGQWLLEKNSGTESPTAGAPVASSNTTPDAGAADTGNGTETAAPSSALRLVLTARGDISHLTVLQTSDRSILYDAPLPRGQEATLSAPDGSVEITVTAAQNLIIEQDGKRQIAGDRNGKPLMGTHTFVWPPRKES